MPVKERVDCSDKKQSTGCQGCSFLLSELAFYFLGLLFAFQPVRRL
jgi:hypothetical protein